jgi:hypothetical protein
MRMAISRLDAPKFDDVPLPDFYKIVLAQGLRRDPDHVYGLDSPDCIGVVRWGSTTTSLWLCVELAGNSDRLRRLTARLTRLIELAQLALSVSSNG